MIMIRKFLFKLTNFCVTVCFFLTKLLTLGILFSTAVNAVFVAKLLASGILFSNSVTFVFLTKSVIHKDIFACLFSIHNIISLSCHEQVCLSGHSSSYVQVYHDMINLL